MSIWTKLKDAFKADSSSSGTGFFFSSLESIASAPANYKNIAEQAYAMNAIVKACIDVITINFVEAKLRVYLKTDNRELPNHRLQTLIDKPNPFTTRFEFWRNFLSYGLLDGNRYIEKIRSKAGIAVELWTLRPDRIEIKPDSINFIRHYIYSIDGRKRIIKPSDIIHGKSFNPLNDYYGMSPIKPGFNDVDTDNIIGEFIRTIIENKGIAPGTIVEVPSKLGELTTEQKTRLKSQWKQAYGSGERGSVAFVTEGMKVNSFGYNMNELAVPDLMDRFESRLCVLMHVPPGTIYAMVGLKFNTYANAKEAREALYEDGIEPLYTEIAESLNTYLTPEFGDDIYLAFDTSDVTALQEQRKAKRDEIRLNMAAGIITINEARIGNGLMPLTNGDVFLRPLMLVEIPVKIKTPGLKMLTEHVHSQSCEHKLDDTVSAKNQGVIARIKTADAWQGKIEDATVKEFTAERKDFDEVAKKVGELRNKASQDDIDRMQIGELEQRMQLKYADWVKRIQDELTPILGGVLVSSAVLAASELGIVFDLSSATQQAFVRDYGFKFAKKITDTAGELIRKQILLGQQGELSYTKMVENLQEMIDGWAGEGIPRGVSYRADMIARTETIRASNYGALELYRANGIEQVEWVAVSDACPYCLSLDGTVVQTGSNFIDFNATYTPDPQEKVVDGKVVTTQAPPMKASYEAISAPPAHPYCKCGIKGVI